MNSSLSPLTVIELNNAYWAGEADPVTVIDTLFAQLASEAGQEAWIHLRPHGEVREDALAARGALADPSMRAKYPLLGIPFAVKDNIDVAGLPTTAACPAFSYVAERSATVVENLLAAGAILVGKTNLDQFATGLVGTRSPFGAVKNPFDPAYMSGGSSAGSATVVARGWVAFSLGTDTAGSGRVPAGACNLVGLKPSPGLVSTAGVLPACRSLDCVSVFTHTVADAWSVLSVLAGYDAGNPFSRPPLPLGTITHKIRIGIPSGAEFFGDAQAERAWQTALDGISGAPGVCLDRFDFSPFGEAARLLYDGPWVAERRAALGPFMDVHGADMDPTVHAIIASADRLSAVDAFEGRYALEALRGRCEHELAKFDLLMLPTAPTIYRHAEIAADPMRLNSRLGTYTNFVNLLGLAALALPGPFRDDGLPAGITLVGAAGSDHRLAEFARRVQPRLHRRLGTSNQPLSPAEGELPPLPAEEPCVTVAVVGAHLSGLELNWQLLDREARLLERTRTAPVYRLYALSGATPPKPGLVRTAVGGVEIEVELWTLPERFFGGFVAQIPPPLAIGTLQLADGRQVQGFLCEACAIEGAEDISRHGGWRNYRAS